MTLQCKDADIVVGSVEGNQGDQGLLHMMCRESLSSVSRRESYEGILLLSQPTSWEGAETTEPDPCQWHTGTGKVATDTSQIMGNVDSILGKIIFHHEGGQTLEQVPREGEQSPSF